MLRRISIGLTSLVLLTLLVINAGFAQDSAAAEDGEVELATGSVSADLVQPGRAIVHARGNHFVVDSVPPLGSPSEERNPLDLLLGSLATCATFIFESGAAELEMPLESLNVTVEGDLATVGLTEDGIDPRVRAFRVMIDAQGIDAEEFAALQARFQHRCPVYTTLVRAAPIDVFNMNQVASVEFDFGTHPQLGFPEQHVFVQQDDLESSMGMRVDQDGAADPANLERELFAAAGDVGHDPFSLEADPLGPFELGESMEMTLGDWLAASGSGTYTQRGNHAEVTLNAANLVPNGVYTLWCTRITVPPGFEMVNKACGPLDGSENVFQADADGNAEFTMSTWALAPTSDETVSVLALAYHSDGNTYDASPGTFGMNSHVQMFTILPPPNAEVWTVSDGS